MGVVGGGEGAWGIGRGEGVGGIGGGEGAVGDYLKNMQDKRNKVRSEIGENKLRERISNYFD